MPVDIGELFPKYRRDLEPKFQLYTAVMGQGAKVP